MDAKWEYDARGIPLCKACPKCKSEKLKGYRQDVLHDPDYEADEPIEPEDDMEESCDAGCQCQKCGNKVDEDLWIQNAIKKKTKGALHKQLHVP